MACLGHHRDHPRSGQNRHEERVIGSGCWRFRVPLQDGGAGQRTVLPVTGQRKQCRFRTYQPGQCTDVQGTRVHITRFRKAWVMADQDLRVSRGSDLRSSYRRCDHLPVSVVDPCADLLGSATASNDSVQNISFDIVLLSPNGSVIIDEEALGKSRSVYGRQRNCEVGWSSSNETAVTFPLP